MSIDIRYPAGETPHLAPLLMSLAPHLLWAIIVLIVIALIGPQRIASALLNARKIGFGGLEIELKADIAEAAAAKSIALPAQLQDQLARRAERIRPALVGARFLWIDDNPTNNALEIRALNRLGVTMDLARNDAEAEHKIDTGVYDLILSDMTRGNDVDSGRKFLSNIDNSILIPSVIFYVGQEQPTPVGAFGLTTRPDDLFNLVFDAMERHRG